MDKTRPLSCPAFARQVAEPFEPFNRFSVVFWGGMRVLIVEDDAAARRGLTELIRAWGYEADSAADGQDGLEKITTYRPSVILADMVMPRMDGLELLHHVKDQLHDRRSC